jgi:Pyruvate/2-oxoacid:ferredoxin oxidoreductase delta subunit
LSQREVIGVDRHLQLYFFSGTGNARNVAEWLKIAATRKNWSVESFNVATIERRGRRPPPENTMLGFIAPTHGFNFPPIMIYFLFRFPPANKANKVFIINTRAGMKLGRIFLPGISGVALWLSALVLFIKGYKIVGLRSIDLPSNWISMHPGLADKTVLSIYERCRNITGQFAEDMLSGKNNFRAGYDIIQDCLVAPVSLLYYLVGRFVFAKSFYAGSRCTGCMICRSNCPVGAIITVADQPFWTYRCESCMKCLNECPERAIETGHGYLAGTLFLVNSWLLVHLWTKIEGHAHLDRLNGFFPVFKFCLDSVVTLFILMIVYRFVHFLKRLTPFRQLIEYTSLTRYPFWRRYNIRKIFAAAGKRNSGNSVDNL